MGQATRPMQAVVKAEGSHPILDRIAKRQRRRQRQQPPGDDEEDARHQRHLHAGNRDDVKDARFPDQISGVIGEEVQLTVVC